MDLTQTDNNEEAVRHDALLTFQGGGAKGIVHVGALMAIEKYRFNLKGVAGTSAGAMVAALVAAGYTADELLNPQDQSHILCKFRDRGFMKATDFFGGWGWWWIEQLRKAFELKHIWLARILVGLVSLAWLDQYHPGMAIVLGFVMLAVVCGAIGLAFIGITTVKRVRDFIDVALKAKLGESGEPGKALTFRDLDERSTISLKIVATNITDEVGEVFSFNRTPDVAVADAVAASICLPVVFRPWTFECTRGTGVSADKRKRRFQDGGLISNLPVWTLDDERKTHQDCITIAFAIRPDKSEKALAAAGEKHWLGAIASAVVSGSMELHTRGVDDIVYVPIKCSLDTLEFDAGLDTLCETVTKSRDAVLARIKEDWEVFPELLDAASEDVCVSLERALSAQVGRWFVPGSRPMAKVAMAMYERWDNSEFVLSYPHGFVGLPDVDYDELRKAWETNIPEFRLVKTSSEWSGPCWRAIVPVSFRKTPDEVPIVDGRPERPLLFIIEVDASTMTSDPVMRAEFNVEIEKILKAVIVYSEGSGLYRAVQRTTSPPWH
jgi:NTE family protein